MSEPRRREPRRAASPLLRAGRRLRRNGPALAGAILLGALYLLAVLAPFVAPYAPTDLDRGRFYHPPQTLHWRDADGRFSDGYFAYSWVGGPHLVMTYDNQAWGIDRMNQVLRHELLHSFFAFDEYSGSGCGCTISRRSSRSAGPPSGTPSRGWWRRAWSVHPAAAGCA